MKNLFKYAHVVFIFFYTSLSINLSKQTVDQQGKSMLRSVGSFAMRLTWIAEGNPIKGSVVMTASLSPTEKSTDRAGESKLKVNNC